MPYNKGMPKRVLFFRTGAIGDIIHCLPAVKLYKEHEPEAQVEFAVGSSQLKDLLESCTSGYIDKVWQSNSKFHFDVDFYSSLDQQSVDEFIYLHSTWLKAWWFNFTKLKANNFKSYHKDASLGARENFALTLFPEFKQGLALQPHEFLDYKVLDLLVSNHEYSGKKYICVVPGVGSVRPDRAYPLEQWFDFIISTLTSTDYDILLLGGPDEADLCKAINRKLEGFTNADRVKNLIAKTSLVDLVSILSQAQRCFSGDTGILHIASALGLPTTSIYAISSELRTGPFSPKATVLRSENCKCINHYNANATKHCKFPKGNYASCMLKLQPEDLLSTMSGSIRNS